MRFNPLHAFAVVLFLATAGFVTWIAWQIGTTMQDTDYSRQIIAAEEGRDASADAGDLQ